MQRWPRRIYLGVGTAETRRDDWNEETVANVRALATILRRAGLGEKRLRVSVEDGASHCEAAWAGRFAQALEFLFGGLEESLDAVLVHSVIVNVRASTASEARDRSAPAQRRARERVGESEGRSPSDKS